MPDKDLDQQAYTNLRLTSVLVAALGCGVSLIRMGSAISFAVLGVRFSIYWVIAGWAIAAVWFGVGLLLVAKWFKPGLGGFRAGMSLALGYCGVAAGGAGGAVVGRGHAVGVVLVIVGAALLAMSTVGVKNLVKKHYLPIAATAAEAQQQDMPKWFRTRRSRSDQVAAMGTVLVAISLLVPLPAGAVEGKYDWQVVSLALVFIAEVVLVMRTLPRPWKAWLGRPDRGTRVTGVRRAQWRGPDWVLFGCLACALVVPAWVSRGGTTLSWTLKGLAVVLGLVWLAMLQELMRRDLWAPKLGRLYTWVQTCYNCDQRLEGDEAECPRCKAPFGAVE